MKKVLSSWFSGFRWWESFTTAGGASLALYGFLAMELKAPQNPSLIAAGVAFAVLWLVFWRNPKAMAWAAERLDSPAVQAQVAESAAEIEARLKAEYQKQWQANQKRIEDAALAAAQARVREGLKAAGLGNALPAPDSEKEAAQ